MKFAMRSCDRRCFHFLRHNVPFTGSGDTTIFVKNADWISRIKHFNG